MLFHAAEQIGNTAVMSTSGKKTKHKNKLSRSSVINSSLIVQSSGRHSYEIQYLFNREATRVKHY